MSDFLKWITSEKEELPKIDKSSVILCFDCTGINVFNPVSSEEQLPQSERHITLLFLGDLEESQRKEIVLRTTLFSYTQAPISGSFCGYGVFGKSEENDGKSPVVALFDSPELPLFRQELCKEFFGIGIKQNHGFTPHMTLGYTTANDIIIPSNHVFDSILFDTLSLWWGKERYSFLLEGAKNAI